MNKFIDYNTQSVFQKTRIGYYHFLAISFCFVFIVSNVAATKISSFMGFHIPSGIFFFPLLYIINDVVTEIYGFKASRKIVWLAIFVNILFTSLLSFAAILTPVGNTKIGIAFDMLFGFAPRILVASISSFLVGEYINAVILSVLKIKFVGKHFPLRAIFSTFVGVTCETLLFSVIAFYGLIPAEELLAMGIFLIFIKVFYEFISIPVTVWIVKYIKDKENIDFYDNNVSYNIFSF